MYDSLKIHDAHLIAKNLLYSKQRSFHFRDKFMKQLAWLLAGPEQKQTSQGLRKPLQLTLDHRISLEDPITGQEISKAIDLLKPNKSPGLEGLSAEMYKMFKDNDSTFKEIVYSMIDRSELSRILETGKIDSISKTR